MKDEIKAIPTEFNGQQYRSRLEADMAMVLTKLGVKFAYEEKSYLLAGGIHYRPDFTWGDELGRYFLETRGYSSAGGEDQLSAFASHVAAGNMGSAVFLVIRADTDRCVSIAEYWHGEFQIANGSVCIYHDSRRKCMWVPVMSKDTGAFRKDIRVVAFSVATQDEDGQRFGLQVHDTATPGGWMYVRDYLK